ncbi:MAG: PhoH family protein [Erysipelotrichaceae bacterium]|nr:PhoH family protein [Erysipelotrichaceae bacterium]
MEYKISLSQYDFSLEQLKKFYGINDENISIIEKNFNCQINANGETLTIIVNEDNYLLIEKCLLFLANKIIKNVEINNILLQEMIERVKEHQSEFNEDVRYITTYNGKVIKAKNEAQVMYHQILSNNTIVFATGCAGTGKTYLAVAFAISMLKAKKVNKIIVTRPIVEAGENLGFLPGELKEKVDPYLTPIYDAFYDIVGKETTDKYLEKGIIEIAPLAYMRGRTLSDAFVILDEAQNTTNTQMKMFLTRLGYNSKMVITGDESQIDLKDSSKSGIISAANLLKNIDDIEVIHFDSKDVIRHPLVRKIISAYEKKL